MGRSDGSIDLYDATTGRLTRQLPTGAVPHTLAFAPDGERLAVSSLTKGAAVQVRGLNGEVERSIALPVAAYSLAWHPGGRQLAAGGEDGRIFLLNLDSSGEEPEALDRHQGAVITLAFHPDGDLLASASWDGTLRLWNVGTGEPIVRAPCPQARHLRFSRDGRLVGPGLDGQRHRLWQVDAGRECRIIADRDGPIEATWGIQFRPEHGLLVTTGSAGVRFDEPQTGRMIAALDLQGTSSSVFTSDGSALLTGGEAGLLRWPVRESEGGLRIGPPEPFEIAGLPTGRFCLAPDGRTLAVVLDWNRGRGVILDLQQPEKRLPITGHPGLERLAFSPDLRWLATGTWHGTGVKVWDAQTGRLEADLGVSGSAEVLFSPDGRWLVTGSGDEYRAWEVGTWHKGGGIGRINAGALPGKMAFSPDGGTLALVRSRSVVQLTDPETFEVLTTLVTPDLRNVASLGFSPDGGELAATHNSRVVTLWNLRMIRTKLAAIGLDLVRPPLTRSEPATAAPTIAIEPPAWLDIVHDAEAQAAAGRWDEAAAAYSAAFDAGDRSPRTRFRRALLLLAIGRPNEYRKACNEMLSDFGEILPAHVEDTVAWTCVVGPDATTDPARAAPLAEAAVNGPADHAALNTLGAALYRAGRFEEALAALERALVAHGSGGTPHDWLFLAMTCRRLGRDADAGAWLKRAENAQAAAAAPAAGDWTRELELRLLREEAKLVVDGQPPSGM
jgi:WD40 repeat protein